MQIIETRISNIATKDYTEQQGKRRPQSVFTGSKRGACDAGGGDQELNHTLTNPIAAEFSRKH